MKQFITIMFSMLAFTNVAFSNVAFSNAGYAQTASSPHSLTVGEGFVNPIGYYDSTPTFSWKLPLGVTKQTAYQLEVKNDDETWDSGWVESDQSVSVPYEGKPLASRQKLQWRVRFKDQSGDESKWSQTANFELGLLSNNDWKAKWIRPAADAPDEVEKVSLLRQSFSLNGDVKHARLYVTARGVFEVNLNGKKVGRDHFANGFTSYANRLDSLTYDITDQLKSGENSIDALLGYGWYAGRFGWRGQRQVYGKYPELLLQIEVTLQDGSKQTIVSDEHWQGTLAGPIASSSIYDGEHFDARKNWSDFEPVKSEAKLGEARIVPKPFAPVREIETLPTREITQPEPGRFVFDLGQNMVGWPKLQIPVAKDQTVTVRFAEMLNADGTVHTKNYRAAKSTDSYTAAKTHNIAWEPKFTFHGFRYVELSGLPEGVSPKKDWVAGVVLHSDLQKTGSFESSHEKLNQLQSNITWGQRGNFLDIPTDCPQRDERAGWTGDAQAFGPTAMFNYDCRAFWKSWLESMRDDQNQNGSIPHVIPALNKQGGSPGWVDAATFIPWEYYVRTGDKEVLADNFEMMKKLVGWYRRQTVDGLIPKIKGFGDWLQPYAKDQRGDTPHSLLALAFYGRSCQIVADSASILGKAAEAKKFAAEAQSIKETFAKHYFDENAKLQNAPETQTAYLLAIAFDLIPDSKKAQATKHLSRLVDEADGHLRTGFLGTPYVVSVFDTMGKQDIAVSLLFKETYPSWFYSINQGATTMWERWNSYSKKDGFSGDNMNSLNHYAYGAIGQWMYERIGGLAPDPAKPGYKHFFVRPIFPEQIDWARSKLDTAYGTASSHWKREGRAVSLEVVVPPNTSATIEFPNGRSPETVGAGTHRFEIKK